MKVFLTKYALSSGVTELEGDWEDDGLYFKVIHPNRPLSSEFHRKSNCQSTKEEAIKAVKELVVKEEKSIQKKLEKLQKIKAKLDAGELPMEKG